MNHAKMTKELIEDLKRESIAPGGVAKELCYTVYFRDVLPQLNLHLARCAIFNVSPNSLFQVFVKNMEPSITIVVKATIISFGWKVVSSGWCESGDYEFVIDLTEFK